MKRKIIFTLAFLLLGTILTSCSKSSSEEKGPTGITWKTGKLVVIHETQESTTTYLYEVFVDTNAVPDGIIDINTTLTFQSGGKIPKRGDDIFLKFSDGNLQNAYAEDDVRRKD